MAEPEDIKVEDLPEHARVRITGPLRGGRCQVAYGTRRVCDVSGVRLEMGGGQVRNKAVLEYVPAEAREQGKHQDLERREVGVDELGVEAIAVGVDQVAGLGEAALEQEG
jgi:hypothetical protein